MHLLFFITVFVTDIHMNWSQLNDDTTVNCTLYKNKFCSAVSDFTSCAITNAKPITLCESCIDTYIEVLDSYHNLTLVSDIHGPCISNYVNLDRLEIMNTLYRNSFDLWNRAKCYECFQISNGVLSHNRSEETITFNALYNSTIACFNKNSHNKTVLCGECMEPYLKLNDLYNSISNEIENIPVCMDIVDLMNGTRSFWSEKCCLYRHHSEYIFLISTGCMMLLTVLFYVLTKMCIDKKSAAIYLQSRFAESLSQ